MSMTSGFEEFCVNVPVVVMTPVIPLASQTASTAREIASVDSCVISIRGCK